MSNRVIGVDLETSSPVDLATHGAQVYADHQATRCLIAYWRAFDLVWLEGDPVPDVIADFIATDGMFSGWNVVGFDRLIWERVLVRYHGFPSMPADNWVDTMHQAAAMNLPRSLAGCAKAAGVPFTGDLKDDNRIKRITNANRTFIPYPLNAVLNGTIPVSAKLLDDLTWLRDRCIQDVGMEDGVLKKLAPFPSVPPWIHMREVDRKINDRGILLDQQLIAGLSKAVVVETARIDAAMNLLTKEQVPKVTNVEALKQWLVKNGVKLPRAREPLAEDEPEDEAADKADAKSDWRLRKSDVADLIARTDLPEHCHQALLYRHEAGKASIAKLRAMARRASADGRLRGAFVLMGAQATGRFSSGGAQLQNLVRDAFANHDQIATDHGLKAKKDHEQIKLLSEQTLAKAIEVGRIGDAELIRSLYETKRKDLQGRETTHGVLSWVSRMGRRILSAPLGRRLLIGDYANIEARIPVWLAGQQDVVDQFARGEDVYRLRASPVYGIAPEQLNHEQRQIGKVMTLFLGFGGGVNAFVPAAMNYGVTISRDDGLVFVKAFRETNKRLVDYWYTNLRMAVCAVLNPGQEFFVEPTGLISWRMHKVHRCLLCRLPSGRELHYWDPQLEQGYWPDGTPKRHLDLTVLVVKGKVMLRRTLWHGLSFENIVQAIATADLLCVSLDNMDRNGLPVVGHFHDADAAEVPEEQAEALLPVFNACMTDLPGWTAGLPIAVDSHISARFG
jgi:DNA polymerase bacteriophage-type